MTAHGYFPRVLKAPSRSFFLFGCRGTGKSTWIRHTFGKAKRFDLLDEAVYQAHLAQPGLFADALRAVTPGSWVIVDEVQRLPRLLNEVHRFIEERDLKFVLCGSSARKLKHSGTNLLAGRAVRREMHPFVPEELGKDFRLDAALCVGTLPIVWSSDDREDVLQAYVRTYLKEEIQAEALVRNLPGFARSLPVAALFHGQALNVASLARDAGVSRTTVAGFIDILEDTLVAFRVPAFEARLRVRERRHPKLYWVDAGIVRALKHHRGAAGHEEAGPLFEGWVANLLRAYASYRDLFDHIYYWAPAEARHTEVDFLLQRGTSFIALEVKAARRQDRSMLTGLRAIASLKGLTRRIVVYRGTERLRSEDGIDVLPAMDLVREIEAGALWP